MVKFITESSHSPNSEDSGYYDNQLGSLTMMTSTNNNFDHNVNVDVQMQNMNIQNYQGETLGNTGSPRR